MDIKVKLHLSSHCIETAAKKEFQRLVDIMLSAESSEDDNILVEKIDLLRNFLLKYNFKELRASDERLTGSVESEVFIFRDADGFPVFKISA